MKHLSEQTLKTITIKKVVVLLNEDTTDEKAVDSFRVFVDDRTGSERQSTEEEFGTQAEAETYAADVAIRPLRPYDPSADLFATR